MTIHTVEIYSSSGTILSVNVQQDVASKVISRIVKKETDIVFDTVDKGVVSVNGELVFATHTYVTPGQQQVQPEAEVAEIERVEQPAITQAVMPKEALLIEAEPSAEGEPQQG